MAARRAGFATALSAGGNADDLVDLVQDNCNPGGGPLLYAAGADQASDLASRLSSAGYDVETAIVYRTDPTMGLTSNAATGLEAGTIDGVLFYSAKSADRFGHQLGQAGLSPLSENVTCFCLSEAIGRVVRGFAAGDVVTGPNTVIDAIAAGKKAAVMIDRYISGEDMLKEVPLYKPSVYIEPVDLNLRCPGSQEN